MKESTKIVLSTIFLIVFFGTLIWWFMSGATNQCVEKYGQGWRSTGQHAEFCMSPQGDIKGRWL